MRSSAGGNKKAGYDPCELALAGRIADIEIRAVPMRELHEDTEAHDQSDQIGRSGRVRGHIEESGSSHISSTVLALNIEEVGHNCWVLEVYLLGI